MRSRKLLVKHEQLVLDEIERKIKYAAYGLCIDDTKTRAITQKSTSITRKTVTQKLKKSFQDELSSLSFRHVEVEIKEVGGTEGVLYHKLVLTRAPGVELPKVVSEGEQRCLSIAAFFAELSTADDPSGIVFDDPVSVPLTTSGDRVSPADWSRRRRNGRLLSSHTMSFSYSFSGNFPRKIAFHISINMSDNSQEARAFVRRNCRGWHSRSQNVSAI